MLRLLAIPAILLALLAGSLVWSGQGLQTRADFAFVNRGDNKTLDLNTMSWAQDIRIAYALWEGLYTLDAQTLQPIPGAAEVIDISPDKKVYTFHLRRNGRWSNGDPVIADDFLFEWRRMLETPGEYTYLHYYIAGAEDYQKAFEAYSKKHKLAYDANPRSTNLPTPPDFASVGEQKIDDYTFRVTLTNPVPFFPAVCAFPPFFPLNKRLMIGSTFVEPHPDTGTVTFNQGYTRPPNLVTNGPYRMAEWSFKRRVRLLANEYYWDAQHVQSKVIDQIYAEDPLAAFRLFEQGDVDWLADVDGEMAAAILQKGGRRDLHIFPGFGTYYYELNSREKLPDGSPNPLRDVRVRQALAMAIDKTPVVRDVARMHQPIATDFVPPGVFAGYHSPPGLPFDVQRARNLMADAGYPQGRGFPRLSIMYNTEGVHADIATVIRRQWQQNLGIELDLRGLEVKQFAADLHSGQFALSRASWSGDYDDPSTFSDKYLSNSENNDAGWKSDKYDELCRQAAIEPDAGKRLSLLSRAEDCFLSEAPIIPLYTIVGAYLFHENVQGISMNARQMQIFQPVHRAAH